MATPDPPPDPTRGPQPPRLCCICGRPEADVKLPFAVGREDTPPLPQKRRILGLVPWKKKFVQRHRWVWHFLWVCRSCDDTHLSESLWKVIQAHPATLRLVAQGYTETRLDPRFQGSEEEVTFTEEPV
jgi:hypothetical protein